MKDKVITVIDDDRLSLELAEQILTPTQAQLKIFMSPEKGLDFLQKNTPDLVILDIMMPKIDGWDVCNQMRMNRLHEKTPIIFLSCLFEVEEENFLNLRSNHCCFLSKPVNTQKLLTAVNHMIL